MTPTLLEIAKLTNSGLTRLRPNGEQRLELALAFSRREVSDRQVKAALGSTGNAHTKMGCTLMTAARNGIIRIEKVKV